MKLKKKSDEPDRRNWERIWSYEEGDDRERSNAYAKTEVQNGYSV